MDNIQIDCRGLACPKPVIETKKKIDLIDEGNLIVIVDNEIAKENIRKFAQSKKLHVEIEFKENDYYLTLTKTEAGKLIEDDHKSDKGLVEKQDLIIYIETDKMGEGNDELGDILMKSYLYTLTELEDLPKAIIFLNSGVKLVVKDSPVLNSLKTLDDMGVELVACGTCLNYYHLENEIAVGIASNMYAIVEMLHGTNKIIRI